MNIVNIWGFNVFSDNLEKIETVGKKAKLLTTISPNSYGISTKDLLFEKSLKNSDFLVLDGVYFALAPILLKGKNIKKNQGPEVFYHFMDRANSSNGKVFFLGSKETTLIRIKERAKKDYPNILIEYYSPPFKEEFLKEDNEKMIDIVNNYQPDVLFVGMTCPKQEKWAYQHKDNINAGLICCIGAVFDWYAGNQKEIKPIWWKLRLAWIIRIIRRPEIIYRIPSVMIFFKHLIMIILKLKKNTISSN
ncbi:MAG: WecB/TagA/CpsF family glycosyltransferase [Lentimicrobiaceae bacterium]|nr:WecB/TagA/CpsF family glycosyltransferase [Lentimicrobiaceae bacterium]